MADRPEYRTVRADSLLSLDRERRQLERIGFAIVSAPCEDDAPGFKKYVAVMSRERKSGWRSNKSTGTNDERGQDMDQTEQTEQTALKASHIGRSGETNGHTHQVIRGRDVTGPGGPNDHTHSVSSGAAQTGSTNDHTHSIPERLRMLLLLIGAAAMLFSAGCITNGVIGPASAYMRQSVDNSSAKRAVMNANLNAADRERFVSAVNLGAGPHDVAVGIGINVNALAESDLTGTEKAKMVGTQFVDAALWGLVINAARDAVRHSGGGGPDAVSAPAHSHQGGDSCNVFGNTAPVNVNCGSSDGNAQASPSSFDADIN